MDNSAFNQPLIDFFTSTKRMYGGNRPEWLSQACHTLGNLVPLFDEMLVKCKTNLTIRHDIISKLRTTRIEILFAISDYPQFSGTLKNMQFAVDNTLLNLLRAAYGEKAGSLVYAREYLQSGDASADLEFLLSNNNSVNEDKSL